MFFHKGKKNKQKKQVSKKQEQLGQSKNVPKGDIEKSLATNIDVIKETTGNSSDIIVRVIKMGQEADVTAAIIYTEGLVDDRTVKDFLIESAMKDTNEQNLENPKLALQVLKEKILPIGEVKELDCWEDLFTNLMTGQTIILVDGVSKALTANTRGGEKRQISEPVTEISIRGPKDSFTETIRTNSALIRKRIKNPNLWLESMKIGKVTQTDVAIMYIKGIVNEKVVEEVRIRLKRINIDSILETGYIEQLIEDKTFTTFPTLFHTERPDVAAANLLEGRVAILVDGTPYVLLAPAVFIQFFQAVDDYYGRFDLSSALRFLRVLIFFISLVGPAIYIAATTFHQEMIPTLLVIALAAQRESVPFPAFVEAMIMEVTFEILREAGVRLPRAIGQTVSIVGAIVLGQSAVQAGFVSPAMLIVVSITAIANFATPAYSIAISARLIRFIIMVMAATFGFYGCLMGILVMVIHLCSLRSFGVLYMTPLAPFIPANFGDTVVRKPIWEFKERPWLISQSNITRAGEHQRPQPPDHSYSQKENEKGEKNDS
ncbi:spore germination protein [Bacillus sp. FSL W8-0102]|uniref:spore germination protein n=1 Tax=Bacillus sp. FSL W8-0102 TaxID=2978205 RepID=UPI0030F60B33